MKFLIHIGLHKTGTSWLQRSFFPYCLNVNLIDHKFIIHDFVYKPKLQVDRARLKETLQERSAGDRINVISSERLSGMPHSAHYDALDNAAILKFLVPDAKILIGCREQSSLILSTYSLFVKNGGPLSLKDYITAQPDGQLPYFNPASFKYHYLVEHYRALFGPQNVLVLPYEVLKRDPKRFVRDIQDFSGIDRGEKAFDFSPVNKSPGISNAFVRRLNPFAIRTSVNGYSPLAIRGVRRSALFLGRQIDAALAFAQEGYKRRQLHTIDLVTKALYEESNNILQKYTPHDLKVLGYKV